MAERILIFGAGAVGGYVGGYLARAGADLTLVDAWPAHVGAMRADGITLEGLTAAECFNQRVRAIDIAELQGLVREAPIDLAFCCVKAYDTDWTARLIRDYLAADGFVVSLQNGINEEVIAGAVCWGRTVGCIDAKIAVELTGPGIRATNSTSADPRASRCPVRWLSSKIANATGTKPATHAYPSFRPYLPRRCTRRGPGLAALRQRRGHVEILASRPDQQVECHPAGGGLGVRHRRLQ